ncbi:MAG: hypothetical protein GY847_25220 [Proteobacteria bacterium]|nr:hypothetical protein [Pseudomonadota bacterium]
MRHGLAHDPKEFLTALKANGERWSPMNAARLVMGTRLADSIRNNMGAHWLNVVIVERLVAARENGEWTFAHSTLQTWIDYENGKLERDEYWQRLSEHGEDGKAEFIQIH